MTNAYLVRYVVPVIIKGIQPAPRGQGQSCQVVTGPAGIEQDHGTPYSSCLTHTGSLAEMTIEDLQGEKAPIFLYILKNSVQGAPRIHQGWWPYLGL